MAINTHAYGTTRMGDDPDTSVVNRLGSAREALILTGPEPLRGRSMRFGR